MAKPANYSVAQEQTLRDMYESVRDKDEATRKAMVQEIAATIQKKERSVQSKLSSMGIYVPKVTVSKVTGEVAAKKDELAKNLVNLVESVVPEIFEGENKVARLNPETIAKANKTDISSMFHAFETLARNNGFEPSAEIVEDENAS